MATQEIKPIVIEVNKEVQALRLMRTAEAVVKAAINNAKIGIDTFDFPLGTYKGVNTERLIKLVGELTLNSVVTQPEFTKETSIRFFIE